MSLNQLVPRKKAALTVTEKSNSLFFEVPMVKYSLIDASKYSFEYKLDDDIDVSMYESDRVYDSDDYIDADFDESVSESDYSYYAVAVASGILTGAFSHLKLSHEDLENISKWKQKDLDKYIVLVAQMAGYRKKDAKGAMSFLKDRVVPFVDDELKGEVKDGVAKVLNQLSCHPTVAGLVFSIFTQFSGKIYFLGNKGIDLMEVPSYYAIGRNTQEKFVYGILYWIYDLALDIVVSKRNILDEIKLPKEVVKLLKELYKLPLFKNRPQLYEEAKKYYSQWIVKIFEKSNYTDEAGDNQRFDLKESIEQLGQQSISDSLPVIINECIVRTFYLVKKFIVECKEQKISSFKEIDRFDTEKVLPFNNRLISKMVLISTGCFLGVNVAGATVKAIIGHKNNGKTFAATLLTEINIAGVGRFVFAVIADSKYWSDDIRIILQRREKNKKADDKAEEEKIINDMMSNDAFDVLSLTHLQTRALYSLEKLVVLRDIEHTKDTKVKEKKQLWLDTWQSRILDGMGMDSPEYFVADEKAIYHAFYSLEHSEDNLRWFYLMAMEMALFKPYYQLGTMDDMDFKKLHSEKYNYVDDQFVRRQTMISQAEIDSLRDTYKKYKNVISGNTKNAMLAVGVTTVTAFATGGLALTFAPGIATLIAGEAVAGLHGAALTSASLAFVGGGSIAAGGLGMAGGTAIITGGGALLGIAGSGSASMAAILTQISSDYWLRQTTKMLTFCRCVLKDRLGMVNSIRCLSDELSGTISKVEANIEELEQEKCTLDKDIIKSSKDCLKYLNKCTSELEKIMK